MGRSAIAALSTEHLLHNLAVIKSRAPQSLIIAMVKANAYGHRLSPTALRLEKYVYSFGVASIDEALALRSVGITIPITLMEGVFEPSELPIAAKEKFHVVFHEQTQLEWLNKYFFDVPITGWLKVDTGMGRLGFIDTDAQDAYKQLLDSNSIKKPIGIMSHFACADDRSHSLNQKQISCFTRFLHGKQGLRSFCNSAAIFSFASQAYEVVRPGLALYGVSPIAGISAAQLGLKPVMTLQARLMAVRKVKRGSTIGYGARYTCPKDMLVGVIAMGYGDGYSRGAIDGTPVLVNGKRCPIVGRISMDMITVDLSDCQNAKVNDPVVLWGEGLPIEQVAPYTGQTPYDLLTAVQSRVEFNWSENQLDLNLSNLADHMLL